jgi:LexA-binding, inner membrane-associated putative hydrolase
MLGVSHATSGAVIGLAVAGFLPPVLGVGPSAGSILTFAAVCAGAALLPDLDHPSSAVTRRFSVTSWIACHAIRPLSALVFDLTRGRRDTGRGNHRGLTHTALGAGLLGLAVNLGSARWGTPVLIGTLFVCLAGQGPRRAAARPAVAGGRGRADVGRAAVGSRRHGRYRGVARHRRRARDGSAQPRRCDRLVEVSTATRKPDQAPQRRATGRGGRG